MWMVWPVMSLRVWMPCVRTWLCSPSMGAEAARAVLVEGENPLSGGATSWMLLIEFFSSVSDFSAVWSFAQMRSQSCCCQPSPACLPAPSKHSTKRTSRGSVTVPPCTCTMPFTLKSCPFWPRPMLMRFAGGCDSLGGWYVHSSGCSRTTHVLQGTVWSHLTFRWRHG